MYIYIHIYIYIYMGVTHIPMIAGALKIYHKMIFAQVRSTSSSEGLVQDPSVPTCRSGSDTPCDMWDMWLVGSQKRTFFTASHRQQHVADRTAVIHSSCSYGCPPSTSWSWSGIPKAANDPYHMKTL
jgi:hypothetical protein